MFNFLNGQKIGIGPHPQGHVGFRFPTRPSAQTPSIQNLQDNDLVALKPIKLQFLGSSLPKTSRHT